MDAMLECMTSSQLNEWMAYFLIEEEQRQEAELAAEVSGNLATLKGRHP